MAVRIQEILEDGVAEVAPLLSADASVFLSLGAPGHDQIAQVHKTAVHVLRLLDDVWDERQSLLADGRLQGDAYALLAQDGDRAHDLAPSAGDAHHRVVEAFGPVDRRGYPVDVIGLQALGDVPVDHRRVGRDSDVHVVGAGGLEDLPEVVPDHRLSARHEQEGHAGLAHPTDQVDRLIIGELLRLVVGVCRHVAVVAQQVAAVCDVPDHLAGPAELIGPQRLVLDLRERPFEEERANVRHGSCLLDPAPIREAFAFGPRQVQGTCQRRRM